MGTKLFKTADERMAWLIKTNPHAIILSGYRERYKQVHGVESSFMEGQRVVILWEAEDMVDIARLDGNLAVMTLPQFIQRVEGDEGKPIWG